MFVICVIYVYVVLKTTARIDPNIADYYNFGQPLRVLHLSYEPDIQ